MTRAAALFAAALMMGAGAAKAQSVGPCDWQASAQALVEPWAQNTAVFANGDVRLAALDTLEPAAGAAYLLVLSPPRAELGERQCRVIGFDDQMGFTAIHFDALQSAYDPAIGLMFTVPVRVADREGTFTNGGLLSLTLNQSTGEMTTSIALGRE